MTKDKTIKSGKETLKISKSNASSFLKYQLISQSFNIKNKGTLSEKNHVQQSYNKSCHKLVDLIK